MNAVSMVSVAVGGSIGALFVLSMALMVKDGADRTWRDEQERQAVRMALLGRCDEGKAYAISAGRVPYDYQRLCETRR